MKDPGKRPLGKKQAINIAKMVCKDFPWGRM